MIKWLFKYAAVIFLFNTVLLNIEFTFDIGNLIFISLMGIFLFFLIINPVQIKNILFHKAFLFFLIINFINLLYFLLFHSISDYEAIKFIISKGMQFSIISVSIYFNYEYYKDKFLSHIVYIVFGIAVLSFVLNPFIFSGRYEGIIWNENMLGAFTITAFSILLLKNNRRTNLDYIMLFTFIIISLSTGSRLVLVALGLVFLMKYGFSPRNIIYTVLSLVITLVIVSYNLDTSINRFVSQSLFNDRIFQYKYAYETFLMKPIFGHGLEKYAFIDLSLVPDYVFESHSVIGAHNGYLAFLTQYGILFGSIVIFIIFKISFQIYLYFRNSIGHEKIYLFIIIYTLIATLFEVFMTGINDFNTILFWFSLAFLSYSKYKQVNES
jgi:O-antigen ligase